MRATPLDVAAVLEAALCDDCRAHANRWTLERQGPLCGECGELAERVLERLHAGVHPDALAALAARILASRSGSGRAKRRGGRTKAERSAYYSELAGMRKHPGRKPKPPGDV